MENQNAAYRDYKFCQDNFEFPLFSFRCKTAEKI